MSRTSTRQVQQVQYSRERTLVRMELAMFRQGYEDGRRHCFERDEPAAYAVPTDYLVMENVTLMIAEWQKYGNEDDLQYSIGDLLGWISAHHIPQGEDISKRDKAAL